MNEMMMDDAVEQFKVMGYQWDQDFEASRLNARIEHEVEAEWQELLRASQVDAANARAKCRSKYGLRDDDDEIPF